MSATPGVALTQQPKRGVGRPPLPDSVRQAFVEAWGSGLTYQKACDTAGVNAMTVQRWREESPDFASAYDRARASRAAKLADETLELAESATMADYKLMALRIGARQWLSERSSRDFASRSEQNSNVRTEVVVRLEGQAPYVPRGRALASLPEAPAIEVGAVPQALPALDVLEVSSAEPDPA